MFSKEKGILKLAIGFLAGYGFVYAYFTVVSYF